MPSWIPASAGMSGKITPLVPAHNRSKNGVLRTPMAGIKT
jgi:hypothetical protein